MSTMEDAKGPYIIWSNYGYEGWHPRSFNTLKEALECERHSYEYVITKKCEYEVNEKSEEIPRDNPIDASGWSGAEQYNPYKRNR